MSRWDDDKDEAVTDRRLRRRRGKAKSQQRAERAAPATPDDGSPPDDSSPPQVLRKLKHWDAVQVGVSLILVGAGVASALASAFGWMNSGVGFAVGLVLGVAGIVVGFVRETLAESTPRRALWMGSVVLGVALILVGVLWTIRPRPSNVIVLTKDLNIAVLPFTVEDTTGAATNDDLGLTFAGGVAEALAARTDEALQGTEIRHDVRAMDVALDLARSPDDLSARASAIAGEAAADFVLTGRIVSDDLGTVIEPLLFVAPERFPDAPELAGWYDGGQGVVADPSLWSNLQSQAQAYQDLREAMVTLIAVGLALEDLSAGRAERSVDALEATARDGDFHIVPRQLVLLLLGNALGREACAAGDCDGEILERAAAAYEEAAAGSGGLARGRVGLGELALQRGQGGRCGATEISDVDLDRAETLYRDVADDPIAPPVARSKALLGLARVDACRTVARVEGAGGSVQRIADTLVAQADAGDAAVAHLAAEARAFEAVVAGVQGRAQDAVRAFDDAIERSKDSERTADWLYLRAAILAQPATCDLARAIESLEDAITIRDRLLVRAQGQLSTNLQDDRKEADGLLTKLRGLSGCG